MVGARRHRFAAAAAPRPWAKVIDQTSCIGCHACTTACKSENEVPLGGHPHLRQVRRVGMFPQARRAFQVTRCNQCADAPCVAACPTRAMYRAAGRHRRLRQVERASAARRASPPARTTRSSSTRRTTRPRSATSARTGSTSGSSRRASSSARPRRSSIGDLNDPASRVAQIVHREPVTVRRPGEGDAAQAVLPRRHQATLDPLAARPPATAGCSCGASRRRRPHTVAVRASPARRANSSRGGAARLRRAAPRAVGLAGQPLHLDQGHRRRRVPRAAAAARARAARARRAPLWLWGAPLLALGVPRRSPARS